MFEIYRKYKNRRLYAAAELLENLLKNHLENLLKNFRRQNGTLINVRTERLSIEEFIEFLFDALFNLEFRLVENSSASDYRTHLS